MLRESKTIQPRKGKRAIAIDARSGHRPGNGVANLTLGLVNAIRPYANEFRLLLVLEKGGAKECFGSINEFEVLTTRARKDSWVVRDLWENLVLPFRLEQRGVGVYHGLDYTVPLGRTRFWKIAMMHDASAFLPFDSRPWISRRKIRMHHRLVAQTADWIIALSHSTKTDLEHYLRPAVGKTRVIWCGIDDRFFQPVRPGVAERVRERLGWAGPYVLYYGGYKRNKNVVRLVEAFAQFGARWSTPLVLVGREDSIPPAIREMARASGILTGRLRFYGAADNEEIKGLLDQCALFVFPSVYEGFGLPVAEAIARGAAVACSDIPPLREIGGDKCVYFNPMDAADIGSVIAGILADGELRRRLRQRAEKGAHDFSWEQRILPVVDLYRELLEAPAPEQ